MRLLIKLRNYIVGLHPNLTDGIERFYVIENSTCTANFHTGWMFCSSCGNYSWSLKANFHYANLVADRPEAGRRPVADLLARARSLLARC